MAVLAHGWARAGCRPGKAGDYSTAVKACLGWVRQYEGNGQGLADFPNLKRWFETLTARLAIQRGLDVGREERERQKHLSEDKEFRKILSGQTAR